ncbi:LuxR C-terminal-related transcriptional regulator [Microlunatus sp. Gsoil 973]|uniref:LuxR C-terminal-related transcriptional regulator n=1 Tax=Microlunatus sp. Gsoil 973 TaxID=2672569 RepID=UPI001E29A864|nr:LuxR C-terminal-related transcriptional regulator [Microlunatus sp. Gsoil 973]
MTQWLTATGTTDHQKRSERGPIARVAWLSLDEEDHDLPRFLNHLVAAFRSADLDVGAEALTLLESDHVPPADAVLVSIVSDLEMIDGRMVVVLDDYHVIDAPTVHEAVTFLIENLPPQVTAAITTRADPPLSLSRLRARGELVEIRAADLRFTPDEAEVFLTRTMDLQLEPEWVAALAARTEGWAAGLQLAALSARTHTGVDGSGGVARFVESFSGTHRFVLDYLVEEVLDRQPEQVAGFLLETSVLDQLTGELCDALTRRSDGRAMLERLERENLFVVPLDDERRWYRYHHLFADTLRARLGARDPGRVVELHAAAGRWLVQNGFLADAVRHGIASADHERVADLIELTLGDLRRRRQDRTIRDWLATLPDDVVRDRPLLATFVGWSRLSHGDFNAVEGWLDAAEAGLLRAPSKINAGDAAAGAARDRDAELGSLPAMIAIYRASVAQARGDVDGTVSQARRALALAQPEDHFARGAAGGFLGLAAWAAGDLGTAADTFTAAAANLHAAGMITDELGMAVITASIWLGRGRPLQARRLYEQALATAERQSGPVLSTVGDLHVGLADVLREQGELEAAAAHLDIARELGERASLPENRHRWYTAMAGLLQARGDLDGTIAMLDRAEPTFLPGYFPDVRPIAATRARAWILQGRLEEAQAWARDRGVAPTDPPTYLAEYDQLTLARLLVAQGRAGEALDLLGQILDAGQAADRDGSLIEASLVRALAHHANGDTRAATADLAVTLSIGVPAGYSRLFLDEGNPFLELLDRMAGSAPEDVGEHAERLLAATQEPSGIAHPRRDSEDGLSARELEVLRLLATELTGPEIARQLFVSVNTLRTHTKHIFTKLDVSTRRAAVGRAVDRGLLSS